MTFACVVPNETDAGTPSTDDMKKEFQRVSARKIAVVLLGVSSEMFR